MPFSREQSSAQSGRLEALRTRHATLARRIEEEEKHPSTGSPFIRRMKIEKLRLRDEINLQESRA